MTTPSAGPAPDSPPPQPGPPKSGGSPDSPPPPPGPDGGAAPDSGGDGADEESFSVSAGGEAAAATSRYGQGSLRNEYLRLIEGDYVGGDKHIYMIGGKRESHLSLLSSRLTGPLIKGFVPPECLAEVQAAFGKRHAVVLRGPDGFGKQALAIRMLLDLCTGPLFQVDQSLDLTRLREWIATGPDGGNRPDSGAGFILDHPQDFTHLHGSVLQGLDEALASASARLVVTVGSGVPVPDDQLLDYIVDVTAAPDRGEIFAGHLRHLAGPDAAGRLLARADIQATIIQELTPAGTCRAAAELASALADEASASEGTEEFDLTRIQAAMSRRGAETFDIWFAGLGETRTRCFAVALAVLNGLPYDTVAKAARALYRRFDATPYMVMAARDGSPPDARRPFRVSRQEWLHRLQARVRDGEVKGPHGKSYTETVEYRDDKYVERVIRRAWSDYEAQDTLLAWLGELAEDNSEQVRVVAGRALGLLATWSFDHVSVNVLGPWASSKRVFQREAVAYALRTAAAASPRLRGNVRSLISGWYASRDNPVAQAAAARAYGLVRGAIDPWEAFQALDRLTVVDDIRVAVAIGDAVADLLEKGGNDFACQVLGRFASSIDDQQRCATIQLAFLIVADTLVTRGDAGGRGNGAQWPFLLHLAAQLADARTALVALWRYVLNGAQFHGEAAQVMGEWARAAEDDPEIREAFLRLARAIAAGDDRSQLIFARYAALWTSADNLKPLPVVSAALEAILAAERKTR